jgi:hypothetical protein
MSADGDRPARYDVAMSGERPPPMPRHPIYQLGYAAPRVRGKRLPAPRRRRPATIGLEELKPIVWLLLAFVWVALLLYAATRWDDGSTDLSDALTAPPSHGPPARAPVHYTPTQPVEAKESSSLTELLQRRFLSTTAPSGAGESSQPANRLTEPSPSKEPPAFEPGIFAPRPIR